MLRINQIIKILSNMKPYAPYTYKSKTDKLIDKIHGKLLAIVIIFIAALVLCIFLYESPSFAKTDVIIDVIYLLYFTITFIGLVIMILPPILGVKHLIDWKKNHLMILFVKFRMMKKMQNYL
ncbi:conserved hypothetical protein [Klebsiella quasipneumoniae subsp. similipneumoniae]|nr:hypothetical protein WP3S18C02_45760 [Klebsiella quasipneumoniae]GKP72484.1 hypothetical protein NUKP47_51800 [Klebsiella quasipneumoniae]GMA03585.1 hypothetical protein KML003_37090 [Klebsiella quasipneumoniae subsp. similipneumoniae]SAZ20444.1 conserved hypothetical protein [Klebsiella quasipneumoniae subsp. similipneumoniae]VGC19497.1 Uncharacterised protein [Klebsiella quasipneumoniae]